MSTNDGDPAGSFTKVAYGHRTMTTAITIDAPPEEVWKVLTDWKKLKSWSPGIQSMKGEIRDGNRVELDYRFQGSVNSLQHTLIYEEGVKFGWSDPVIWGVTDLHLYRVEALPDGSTRFHQTDELRGRVIAELIGMYLAPRAVTSYLEFNVALKAEVERRT